MIGLRGLVVVILAVIGIGGTYTISDALRTQARQSWELEASNMAQSLSGTHLGWLDESYAPLSGLAALIENSENLTEAEFLNAFDGLEARATSLFLEAAALAVPGPKSSAVPWKILFASNQDGVLSVDSAETMPTELLDAIKVAKNRFGEIILGRPLRRDGEGTTVSPIALGTFNSTGNLIIVGLVDHLALIKSLFNLHVPPGVSVKLAGRFPEMDGPGAEVQVLRHEDGDTLHSVPTRTLSAGAELLITWDFNERFSDGPDTDLANAILFFGIGMTLFTLMFMGFLLSQNQTITRRVIEATAHLDKQTSLLMTVLRSITQGLSAYDKDMNLIIANEKFKEIRGVPDKYMEEGSSFVEWIEEDAARGEFNVDDTSTIMDSGEVAPNLLIKPHHFIRTRPNGAIIEIEGGPLPEGGFVSTFLDITERKKAEEALAEAYATISSSIDYASHIQRSILPVESAFEGVFSDHFVIWEPRNVVGGDIYWLRPWGEGTLLLLGDCTGHGVPGAFMTMIVTGALDRAQSEISPGDVSALVQRMHLLIQETQKRDAEDTQSRDGMELGVCYFDGSKDNFTFCGARFSLFVSGRDGVQEIKGGRKGIGYGRLPADQTYETITVSNTSDSAFYMTTDGIIDQIGGPARRGFSKRRFVDVIASAKRLEFNDQRQMMIDTLRVHQGEESRLDDVAMIAFRL